MRGYNPNPISHEQDTTRANHSRALVSLYTYERQRVACGAMAEATYRNNARLVLEGDGALYLF